MLSSQSPAITLIVAITLAAGCAGAPGGADALSVDADAAADGRVGNDAPAPLDDTPAPDDVALDGAATQADADAASQFDVPGNDPRCPSSWSTSYCGAPCSPVGLTCSYRGPGGNIEDALFCNAPRPGDGGVDAGPTFGCGA